MRGLKIRFWFEKNRKLLIVFMTIICIYLSLIIWRNVKLDISFIVEDAALFGVMGTLLGAVIGGAFSLLGSIWINNRQQRALQNVKRKNVIYCPLYDELVDIQNNILMQNPFPSRISFEKQTQTMIPYPQYDAWRRIKSDTRYLEVPDFLKIQIEKLEKSICQYINKRECVNNEIQRILNEVLVKNELEPCCISNIGSFLSRDILLNNGVDIYEKTIVLNNKDKIDDKKIGEVNNQVWALCNSNPIVGEVRACYDEWQKIQRQTIEMLSIMIKRVLLKYEE